MGKLVKEITVLVMIIILTLSCSPQKYIHKKTDKLVEKIHTKDMVDTIFSYSSDYLTLIWFYKDNGIQSYTIEPYNVKRYPLAIAKNIRVKDEEIERYFDESIEKNIECFPTLLFDGADIRIYIKNRKELYSFFDMRCLFNKKYDINSFPYKLQYDFSKIFRPDGYSVMFQN